MNKQTNDEEKFLAIWALLIGTVVVSIGIVAILASSIPGWLAVILLILIFTAIFALLLK